MNNYRALKLRAKKFHDQTPIPAFEQIYGFNEETVLTRIERKFGNGKVPSELSTLGLLLRNAKAFDPFDNVMFCTESMDEPSLDVLGLRIYRKVIAWNHDAEEYGFDEAYKRLSQYTKGNAAREWAEITAAINHVTHPPVTTETFLELYRNGVNRQLGGIE